MTREERDRKIVENVSEILKIYDSKFVNKNEYIINYTYTLSDIINLNDNIQCIKHIDVEINKLSIPIFLHEPIVVDTVHSVYKLVLRWKIHNDKNTECMIDRGFGIKNELRFMYKIETSGIWKELQIGDMNGCQVNINDLFKYEIVYEFRMNYISEYSIKYELKSNVQKFVVSGIANKIILEYVEHFGNHIDRYHHPKYLLNENYLYSSLINSSVVDHDWIIFRFKEKNKLYLPTKVHLKNVKNEKGITMINIYIGDIKLNEWILLEPNDINIKRTENKQTFVIYAAQKSVIQRKKYQYIKLIMNNTKTSGYVWYSFYEFGIDGIEIGKLEIENNLTQINGTENKQRIILKVDDERSNDSYFTISGITTVVVILLLLCFWNIFTEMNDKHSY